MKPITIVTLAALTALASCQSQRQTQADLPRISQAPTVEGSWVDPNGIVSTFLAGQFETRTTDGTNSKLASGTYTTMPNGVTQINLFSNIKQTTTLVNCSLAGPSQLNCTSQAGSQFSLTRRA
ncbi:hypothetical protein [Pararhizobium sp.]|uniref:hypothetical protein n=1 Tax=Pararhizobium sp. TaxID=1977563 RepID=UPI002715D467|nr:hypothetical protein [Pararhizobium sp.]MDO9415183.1 hypothetical protein [Pararhizobium sp.]